MKKTSYDLERTPSRYDLERSPGLAFANWHGVEIQFSKNPEQVRENGESTRI